LEMVHLVPVVVALNERIRCFSPPSDIIVDKAVPRLMAQPLAKSESTKVNMKVFIVLDDRFDVVVDTKGPGYRIFILTRKANLLECDPPRIQAFR
jgi:hypothetical protein